MAKIKFAPKEIFDQMLEWAVIPTFDLVVEYGDQGVILVKRKIAPYQNIWALPGLRMFKGEEIEDTLNRIAHDELGLNIDPSQGRILGQYVGKFRTEHKRQDLSTGYYVQVPATQRIQPNEKHFSSSRLITSRSEIPQRTGAMYQYYLNQYFDLKESKSLS